MYIPYPAPGVHYDPKEAQMLLELVVGFVLGAGAVILWDKFGPVAEADLKKVEAKVEAKANTVSSVVSAVESDVKKV